MCTKLFRWNRAPLRAAGCFQPTFSKCALNPAEERGFYDSPHCQKPQRLSTLLNSEVQECFERKANKQTGPKDSIIFHNIWRSLYHLLYTNYRPLKRTNMKRHRTTRRRWSTAFHYPSFQRCWFKIGPTLHKVGLLFSGQALDSFRPDG